MYKRTRDENENVVRNCDRFRRLRIASVVGGDGYTPGHASHCQNCQRNETYLLLRFDQLLGGDDHAFFAG